MRNLLNLVTGKKIEKKKTIFPIEEIIFDVKNFNTWFCHPDNGAVYANKGIFLRLDKLSDSHIYDYLKKCYGIDSSVNFSISVDRLVRNFYNDIRLDWITKLNKSNHESVYGC